MASCYTAPGIYDCPLANATYEGRNRVVLIALVNNDEPVGSANCSLIRTSFASSAVSVVDSDRETVVGPVLLRLMHTDSVPGDLYSVRCRIDGRWQAGTIRAYQF